MKLITQELKLTLLLIAGFVLCIFGMMLLTSGFIVPPLGIIDNIKII